MKPSTRAKTGLCCGLPGWQPNPELRTAQRRLRHRQGAALPLDRSPADRQPKAKPAAVAIPAAVQRLVMSPPSSIFDLNRSASATLPSAQACRIPAISRVIDWIEQAKLLPQLIEED